MQKRKGLWTKILIDLIKNTNISEDKFVMAFLAPAIHSVYILFHFFVGHVEVIIYTSIF